jgi:hypothetical protein
MLLIYHFKFKIKIPYHKIINIFKKDDHHIRFKIFLLFKDNLLILIKIICGIKRVSLIIIFVFSYLFSFLWVYFI